MNENIKAENIQLFKSVFQGREDVFAVRWEKGNKSGYMPAYYYDPWQYRMHKMKGGTFQNFNDKSYLKLTETEIEKHLKGIQQIGLYPLLQDNTSRFLAADFDKEKWQKESVNFLHACREKNIPAYLERSRSGNGGHVWIFFEQPWPAIRSRKIFISILEQSGAFSILDKSSSFDRVFPNQDFHSGKGLGNLIALPLFKPVLEKGNGCFVHSENFEPVADQWKFLKEIKRLPVSELEKLYQACTEGSGSPNVPFQKSASGKLEIVLSNQVTISRSGLTLPLISFLKEELNFTNSEFVIKKKSGHSTFGTVRYFKLVEEAENEVTIPRGFIGRLIRFCKEAALDFQFTDERKLKPPIPFLFNAQLREHQKEALEAVSKKDFGVIVAPTGSGKTILGLKIIAEKKQPALIVVHRKQLLEQWVERVEAFLGIPRKEVGIIGQGKAGMGKQITIATIQSLPKQMETVSRHFGTIIVDECHHIPAESFRNTIEKMHTFYLYGLTATPFRKYNDGKLIFTHLGEIITHIKPDEVPHYKQAKIIIRNTEFDIPYNSKTDNFETLSKVLIHDSTRNKLIVNDVRTELNQGKKIVIITERKEHIDTLHLFLKQSCEALTLSGDDSESHKKSKWKLLQEGNFQVLITTGQYFGEGTDLPAINTLFLVYPFSFHGKLIQYIGRVQRSEINPVIYDYRDYKIDYLNKLFLKRNTYYRKIEKKATLFDEPGEETATPQKTTLTLEKKIKVLIEGLDFHYGHVSFEYTDNEINVPIEFEIENMELRPEYNVLKAYFIKILKSKTISVDLFAEFENGKPVSQSASSKDIEHINKEIVESVKFKFLNKNIMEQKPIAAHPLLTSDELQHNQKVYADAESILTDILKNKPYKHSRNIQFLADRHESEVMKIRFVLNPFSFVFLLSGEQRYHLVLETLDTEEATYIWHTVHHKAAVIEAVKLISQQLNFIRTEGRQAFLDNNPESFSKILHDYTDCDKGFIIWKSLLEERIN